MKILDIEIENIRGIRKKIILAPGGKNIVIYGPNGTGKSAVVDAIEFLFTGDISRLAGRGTRGMSFKDHGPHIDAEASDAIVKAKIIIDGIPQPISIERRMSKPQELICPEKSIFNILEIAQKGQLVLSRSEILKYIAAESGKRAEEIQAILNLDIVEELRKTLVTIKREADRAVQTDKTNFDSSIASILATTGIQEFSEEELLRKVNQCRATLKGGAIERLDINEMKREISLPSKEEKESVNPETLRRTIKAVDLLIREKGLKIYDKEKELRQIIKRLKEDENIKREMKSKKLLDLGISLLDEIGTCPLCLTRWQPGKLEIMLRERLEKAKKAEAIEKEIRKLTKEIDTEVTILKSGLSSLSEFAKTLKVDNIKRNLDQWAQKLADWSEQLKNAVEDYPTEETAEEIKILMAYTKWAEHSGNLEKVARGLRKLTPNQEAWDTLTALKPVLERYIAEKKKYEYSKIFADRATALSEIYSETKDRVLEGLFNSVNQDFTTYYKFLHGEDENKFYSELKPEGANLSFKVDFYGRGTHHPRALHSEGHQDSMGLCLYLALNRKISENKIKLIILDDVVMSIDNGHRRGVCKLMMQHFPDCQFIITTHNRTWARQLNTDGVVQIKNMIEFKGWSVSTGPEYGEDSKVWDGIRKKLAGNEIASAAHQLREHAEFFYENVCDALKGEVCYRTDSRYDFGDYLRGAKEAYKKCLKLAKNAANSWDNKEDLGRYEILESQINEIIQRTQAEQWGINENVHFSKYADFSKADILPIVDAFEDLEGMFKCSKCQGIIYLNREGKVPKNAKCPCGNITWNLELKLK